MEFLVQISVKLPAEMDESAREQLLEAEQLRGRELIEAGKIRAIWRIPGGFENVGIWDVADATELHHLLTTLPLFKWLSVDTTALAKHPLSPFLMDWRDAKSSEADNSV